MTRIDRSTFNRTSLELKQLFEPAQSKVYKLLIEPVWN